MTGVAAAELLLSLLLVPLIPALVDIIPNLKALRGRVFPIPPDHASIEDFTVLVPIYGNVKYLENVDYLRPYGSRVVLVTTCSESDEFNRALDAIAGENGFSVFRTPVARQSAKAKRQTAGTIRDQIIRDASEIVTTGYVVCIDADTVTDRPLGELVGALEANNLDLASVKLVPSNTRRLLGRLQAHEYHMVMRLRRVLPFVCSGACQVARHEAHREIMRRHSLFFQGNDVELGLLADALGYRVGFLTFTVPTTVPDRIRPWFRQRFAWAGGEFRLFIVNPQLVIRHPFYAFYGAIVVILLVPLRWINMERPGLGLVSMFVLYWAIVIAVNWRQRDWSLLVYPFYGMFISLVLVPVGVVSYLLMAVPERNWGRIRVGRLHRRRPGPRSRREVENAEIEEPQRPGWIAALN
jgi:cellulose synthase/poly-beta-1,6-N-acetylglucosamine synthase-like glycosyltransferase